MTSSRYLRLSALAFGLGLGACRVVYDFPSDDASAAGGGGGPSGATGTGGGASTASSAGGGGATDPGCLPAPELVYAQTLGGDDLDEPTAVGVEGSTGVSYVSGITYSTTFALPSGTDLPCASDIYNDMFLVKVAADGQVPWGKVLGTASSACSASFRQRGQAVNVDPHGHVVVAGRFDCTLDFGDSGGCDTSAGCLVASGASLGSSAPPPDVFIAELDADGHHLWSRAYGDVDVSEDIWDAVVDSTGRITWTGKYSGTMDLGGHLLPSSPLEHRGFLAVLDDDGNHLWSHAVSHVCNASNALTCRVAADTPGNVYWVGDFAAEFTGAVDFGGAQALSCPCTRGGFRARYLADGSLDWQACMIQACDAATTFVSTDVVVTADGARVVVLGRLTGTADFGFGSVTSTDDDTFVLELNPATGEPIRVLALGGVNDQLAFAGGFDAAGGLSLFGNFKGSLSVGDCTLNKADPTTPWPDLFLLHVDSAFLPTWADSWGNEFEQGARAMALADDGSLVIAGRAQGNLDLGSGPLPTHGMSDDLLVARFRPPAP